MPMSMENLAIAQHQNTLGFMPLFVEMLINLKFLNLSQGIMCTCNRQYRLLWM